MANTPISKRKPWTEKEETILLNKIKEEPYNLTACFMAASKEIKRTPGAISSHWYTVLSKKPGVLEFGTISSKHFAKNRKNGKGVPVTPSIWRRFVALIKKLV